MSFPTAGSCCIVTCVLWAWRDARATEMGPESRAFQDAFVVASAVGILIAARATLAGAAGGCQAECGAAGAMAAAGLATLLGAAPEAALDAAALSLKNSLGLACDPVGGLVEVPCAQRNAVGAVNAVACAEMALAGLPALFRADAVIETMGKVGRRLPEELRETARGGLAALPWPPAPDASPL